MWAACGSWIELAAVVSRHVAAVWAGKALTASFDKWPKLASHLALHPKYSKSQRKQIDVSHNSSNLVVDYVAA